MQLGKLNHHVGIDTRIWYLVHLNTVNPYDMTFERGGVFLIFTGSTAAGFV
jgi:hypothetical protein